MGVEAVICVEGLILISCESTMFLNTFLALTISSGSTKRAIEARRSLG